MQRIVERPGALDVHQATVMACVRVWQQRELREHVAEFKTTVDGLLALRDRLKSLGVRQVAMEATGVYCKPVWAVSGTCSRRASCTATSATTTSPATIPTVSPDAWSADSKRSATPSCCRPRRSPRRTISLQAHYRA